MTYDSPTTQDIADTTGVNLHALGLDQDELDALLATLLRRGEADIALQVTGNRFRSNGLSEDEVSILQEAVCWAVAVRWLGVCAVRKGTGTFQPLRVEDSRDLSQLMTDFTVNYVRLAGLVVGTEGPESQDYYSSHATGRPAPTFTRGMEW